VSQPAEFAGGTGRRQEVGSRRRRRPARSRRWSAGPSRRAEGDGARVGAQVAHPDDQLLDERVGCRRRRRRPRPEQFGKRGVGEEAVHGLGAGLALFEVPGERLDLGRGTPARSQAERSAGVRQAVVRGMGLLPQGASSSDMRLGGESLRARSSFRRDPSPRGERLYASLADSGRGETVLIQ